MMKVQETEAERVLANIEFHDGIETVVVVANVRVYVRGAAHRSIRATNAELLSAMQTELASMGILGIKENGQ